MKQIIAAILSAAGAGAFAVGIVSVVDIGTCLEPSCATAITSDVTLLIGGSIAFMVAAFLWYGSWFVGPVVGLVTAAVLLVRDGVDLTGSNLGFTAFIALSVLAGPLLLGAVVLRGRQKAKLAQHLVQTGRRGVAHVQGAQQTGVYINNQPQIRVRYTIHPLDGSPSFAHDKTQTLSFTEVAPRPGLAWPAWYDPADPRKVAIGAPSGAALDPQTEATLSQFGLTPAQVYGYDPRGGQQPPIAPSF